MMAFIGGMFFGVLVFLVGFSFGFVSRGMKK